MSTSSLMVTPAKEEVGKGGEDSISELTKKYGDGFLIIGGDFVAEEGSIYRNSLYLSVFYRLLFMKERVMDMLEEQ